MKPLYKAIAILLVASLAACASLGDGTRKPDSDPSVWQGIEPFCCASSAS